MLQEALGRLLGAASNGLRPVVQRSLQLASAFRARALTGSNWRLVGLLTVSCLLLAGSSYVLVQHSVSDFLRSEAERTAEDWARHFVERLPHLEAIANGQALSAADIEVVENIQHLGSVFLFKIFDRNGNHRLASDKQNTFVEKKTSLLEHNAAAAQVLSSGKPFVTVQEGAGKANRPLHYAEAYVPVVKDGHTVAIVEVYVDQTTRGAEYRATATSASVIVSILAALAFGIPALAFYARSQQVARADQRIHFLAQHDALTGLPNRVQFQKEMSAALAARRAPAKVGVFYLDLDRFKSVNDGLGHIVGDELLRAVAGRIVQHVRAGDVVARLGGDEFAIIQPNVENRDACESQAARLIAALSEPFQLDRHQVLIGASIGVSVAPDDANEAHQLLKAADIALHYAKLGGRGAYRVFEPGLDEKLQKRRELESDLQRAVAADQFELHYQPQLNLESNQIVGYEALLRWRHPAKGLISPADFIPLAEETGLIKKIGAWVLQQACGEAMSWPQHLHVAVNLSAVQFEGGSLALDVVSALARSGLPADRLELEITESVLMRDTQPTLKVLRELKELGVRISMDDFGTGYSSLSYLQKFSFDKIKIDKSFIDGLGIKAEAPSIIQAVISLGRSLGMTTTAEGVETAQQLDLLRAAGCSEIQGFLISRPLPAQDLCAMADHINKSALSAA